MEKLIRARGVRLALAFVLIGLGLWAFVPYLAYRVAPSAFVNAELMRVTAPFNGQLARSLPRKGEFFEDAVTVKLIDAMAPDRRQFATLELQHMAAKSRVELAQAQLIEIAEADRSLQRRTDEHRKAMVDRLSKEFDEAVAVRSACRVEEDERRKNRSRVEHLAPGGSVSQSSVDEAQSTHGSALARCQAAEARIQKLKSGVDAAQIGIFLQDGYNDTPYSQQQRDRLMLRRQELETDQLRERARVAQIESEIIEERARLTTLSHYDLPLPTGHIVWTVLASPGSAVIEGQAILDLADCRRRFVAVELPERDTEAVQSGDQAWIRIVGGSDWVSGRIQQVRGSAARSDERLLAAQVPKPNDRNVTVEVALPNGNLPADSNRFCNIGRLAEVRFGRNGLDLISGASTLLRRVVEAIGLGPTQVAVRSDAVAN